MNLRHILSLSAIAALGFALLPGSAVSQQKSLKEQITGTWTLVSNENINPDGTKRQPFGSSPKGILVVAANGHFAQTMVRSDVPKFKINNRLQGTPEENTAAMQGATALFGTWSVDEAGNNLIVRVEGHIFPNSTGTESKRSVTVVGDQLRMSNPTAASGGRAESVWNRRATVASR